MRKFISFAVAIFAAAVCVASAKDDVKIVNAYDYEGFKSLKIKEQSEVKIVRSDEYSLTVAVGEDYVPYVSVDLNKKTGLLTIEYEKLPFKLKNSKKKSMEITVAMPCLDALQLSGSVEVKVDSVFTTSTLMEEFILDVSGSSKVENLRINATKLSMDVSGSSKVELSGEFGELSADISGASKVTLEGAVESLDAEVSGASKLNSEELVADDISISVSGASKANLYVVKSLEVSVSGASHCTYISPEAVKIDVKGVNGASSFKRKEKKSE